MFVFDLQQQQSGLLRIHILQLLLVKSETVFRGKEVLWAHLQTMFLDCIITYKTF